MSAPEPSALDLAVTDLDESGQATCTFYAGSAADWQWTDEEIAATGWESAACTPAPWTHMPARRHRIEDHLAKAREQVTVSVDPDTLPRSRRPPPLGPMT